MEGEAGKPGTSGKAGKAERKTPTEKKPTPDGPSIAASNRRILRIGIVVLALVAGLVAWVATSGDDDGSAPASTAVGAEAKIVSVEEFEEFAAAAGHEVYWAGPLPRKVIEASESSSGNVEVRYLDEGMAAGEGGAAVLTVGSYPLPDAAKALEGFAKRKGSISRRSPDGREVAFSLEKPTSVYFTGSEGDVQVEVYDPNYKRALNLALSDQLRPVG